MDKKNKKHIKYKLQKNMNGGFNEELLHSILIKEYLDEMINAYNEELIKNKIDFNMDEEMYENFETIIYNSMFYIISDHKILRNVNPIIFNNEQFNVMTWNVLNENSYFEVFNEKIDDKVRTFILNNLTTYIVNELIKSQNKLFNKGELVGRKFINENNLHLLQQIVKRKINEHCHDFVNTFVKNNLWKYQKQLMEKTNYKLLYSNKKTLDFKNSENSQNIEINDEIKELKNLLVIEKIIKHISDSANLIDIICLQECSIDLLKLIMKNFKKKYLIHYANKIFSGQNQSLENEIIKDIQEQNLQMQDLEINSVISEYEKITKKSNGQITLLLKSRFDKYIIYDRPNYIFKSGINKQHTKYKIFKCKSLQVIIVDNKTKNSLIIDNVHLDGDFVKYSLPDIKSKIISNRLIHNGLFVEEILFRSTKNILQKINSSIDKFYENKIIAKIPSLNNNHLIVGDFNSSIFKLENNDESKNRLLDMLKLNINAMSKIDYIIYIDNNTMYSYE